LTYPVYKISNLRTNTWSFIHNCSSVLCLCACMFWFCTKALWN